MANSKKVWWLLPTAAIGCGGVAVLLLYAFADFELQFCLKEGAVLSLALLLTASQLLWIICAYPTRVGILAYAFATGLVFGGIAVWLHELFDSWLLSAAEKAAHADWLQRTFPDRCIIYISALLLLSIILALYRRIAETESRYALQQDAAALLKEAELFKLRQQLQPHFLFNSLNAISALVITAPDKAGDMISRLADFLRTAVKQGQRELLPLQEEIDYLQQYLWIEAVRFGDRLRIEWNMQEAAQSATMPPFLLQPLVENAIRFGVYGRTGEVAITIHVVLEDGMLRISITNPYDPSMKAGSGTGFGLEGVRRRLWLVYARQDLLHTSEAGGHFTTTLLIPQ